VGMQISATTVGISMNVPQKLKPELPYELLYHSWECIQRNVSQHKIRGTCSPMFIAALFIISKLWNQPKCPTTGEWIKKMWYNQLFFSHEE
jgi:hypothetical protein